ncbi:MAG: dihydropteroate synthase [Rhodospirillales bacterium RIFCSPLOWO2_12_FULL_58_28]|nr:MAG: dihydropteroate synthase [Rhodospirillales bacterium RIFCSPLOWO2_02_FULL_58_16]OHC78524.1 MAG: dihydropteroate synthase [Rhodospirillales bacterium RIFCSPLOWO2_12_FULL_58_28]
MIRYSFAGLTLEPKRPLAMGVINVTPDSFSDGGEAFRHEAAIARGREMIKDGASILDIGGESTRPGAVPVSVEQELDRVIPVIGALAGQGAVISIDTRKAEVMEAALKAGADIINDITALGGDARSLATAAAGNASVILMHMQGEPGHMQDDPRYQDAPREIMEYLAGRIAVCEAAGIKRSRIAVDPGIGFGKTARHNMEILNRLDEFSRLGCALVLGVSRKRFIAALSRNEPPEARLAGSLAAALAGAERGVHILRVHDVAETMQALKVWRAIADGGP